MSNPQFEPPQGPPQPSAAPETGRTCPACERELSATRNFCPYCGHDLRAAVTDPPLPPPTDWPQPTPKIEPTRRTPADAPTMPAIDDLPAGAPPQMPSPVRETSPRPPRPALPRRFRLADRRVLFGILGMLDIPVILLLLGLLVLPRLPSAEPSVCDQLDADRFAPVEYERGLGGELIEDTLFKADTEYVIRTTLVVPPDRRLLIEPGARLSFEEGAALEARGGLYVCGSGRKPVTFTSDAGKPGSWEGIRLINSPKETTIGHALIQFAGDRAVYLENSAPTLTNVKISNSNGFPISSDGNAMPEFGGDVDLDENPFNGIEVRSGTLSETNIEWRNDGLVYVVTGPLEVGANTSLTVAEDVTVKFWHAPGGRLPGIGVRGLLKAEGVTFTSIYDSRDIAGGATYVESQDPRPGDWGGVGFFESSSKAYMRHCLIQYAGEGQVGAVSMQASSPELTDDTIADAAWYPLSTDADSFPTLENLTLSDNEPGNALEIRGGSAITGRQERTWKRLGEADQIVRVIQGDVVVAPEAALTIEPGVVVKFEEKGRLIIRGTLHAVGGDDETQRVVFTSLRDDDYGGETDKATGPRDVRSWGGIVFERVDARSVLQNSIVRYASISLNDAAPRLINVLITDSESAGLWASPSAAPELHDIRLRDNGANGMAIWKANIAADTSWPRIDDGNEQLIRVLVGEVTVAEGATLSIEPGTIIKADPNGRLRVLGGLRVRGEEDQPVVFTSLHDDLGGNTNQKLQEARAGDWYGIELGAQADGHFSYTLVHFARHALVLRRGSVPTIDGWLRATDGQLAVWCDGDAQLPDSFQPLHNENNETHCPNQ